jgi:asparagine synthase (glutamine-hydrolysing)
MCGIAGICCPDNEKVDPHLLEQMISMVHHRGPDEWGTYSDNGIGLAHARLSIIDIATGQQPMCNPDKSVWISFNGEIFNYVELRDELLRAGHQFTTQSDTEVILRLYEDEGEDCVRRMNGQWAFAIWDARQRKLFLSRDRLGVRPLFYTSVGSTLIFGSEIKSIFADPRVPRELDLEALDQIFTFWCTIPPRSIFKHICELPPGHSLTVQHGKLSIRPYWQLSFDPVANNQASEHMFRDQLESLLVDATRLRLRSDVPVGAYLSGGLDSTIITALINQFTNSRLSTFSIGFSTKELDESAFQQEANAFLHTANKKIQCELRDIAEAFPDVVWHMEKPVIRTAPAPMHLLSKLVRDSGCKVVLTGEGADEVFGGYDIYKEAKIRRFWASQPASQRRAHLLRKLYPYQPRLRQQSDAYLQGFFRVRESDLQNPFFSHLLRWELTSRVKLFYSDEVRATLEPYDCVLDLASQLPPTYSEWDKFCQAQYLETAVLLPGYILSSQGDRVAMSHSVEARHPYLDYRVVELGAQMPPSLKMKVLNEKYILKSTFGHLLPQQVVARPKQPYRAPDGQSFFGTDTPGYVEELLSPEQIKSDGVFDPHCVRHLVDKFRAGEAIGVKDSMALVGILSTQLVIHQFITHYSQGGPSWENSKAICAAS